MPENNNIDFELYNDDEIKRQWEELRTEQEKDEYERLPEAIKKAMREKEEEQLLARRKYKERLKKRRWDVAFAGAVIGLVIALMSASVWYALMCAVAGGIAGAVVVQLKMNHLGGTLAYGIPMTLLTIAPVTGNPPYMLFNMLLSVAAGGALGFWATSLRQKEDTF